MKEVFNLMAHYNRKTNLEMLEILDKAAPEVSTKETGSYFHSIIGILNHLMNGDIAWTKRILAQYPQLAAETGELPEAPNPTSQVLTWKDLESLKPVRTAMDDSLTRLVGAIPEAALQDDLKYRNFKGEEQSKKLWLVLQHVFNHQTHHRGQISVLLDQASVPNDYSNLAWKF